MGLRVWDLGRVVSHAWHTVIVMFWSASFAAPGQMSNAKSGIETSPAPSGKVTASWVVEKVGMSLTGRTVIVLATAWG